jgi:hypothetical protein
MTRFLLLDSHNPFGYNSFMSKKDKLEFEYNYIREIQSRYFNVMLALLTGMAALIYAVISGEKQFVVLWLVGVGLIALVVIGIKIRMIDDEIKKIIEEMEEI